MKKTLLLLIFLLSFISLKAQFPKPTGAVSIPTYAMYRTAADSGIHIYQGSTNLYNSFLMKWDSIKLKGWVSNYKLRQYRLINDTIRLKGTATIFDLRSYTLKNDSSKFYKLKNDSVTLKGYFTNYKALSKVPTSRTITTTAPLTIAGTTSADLSADRTLAISAATPTTAGSLSAADKVRINNLRLITDHDSLSTLQEKSYNSLNDKPNLAIYRQLNNHDSLSTLDEKNYASLTNKPAVILVADTSSMLSKYATDVNLTYKKDLNDSTDTDGYTRRDRFAMSLALKQNLLTNPVTGTGTQNYLSKWNNAGGTTLGDGILSDNGSEITFHTYGAVSDVNYVNRIYMNVANDAGYGSYINNYWINGDGTTAFSFGYRKGGVDYETLRMLSGAATFVSSVSATQLNATTGIYLNGSNTLLKLNRAANTAYQGIQFQTATSSDWFIGARENDNDLHFLSYDLSSDIFTLSKSTGILTSLYGITSPSINLITGAAVGKAWLCTNATTGAGQWSTFTTTETYMGTVDGDDGIINGGATVLVDGTGTAGYFYRCIDAGTFNYDIPHTGHPITLAVGDDIIYNGTIWQLIPAPIIVGNALTKTDDTNITLTLGGSPTTALLNAASITAGWTGTLASDRITSTLTGKTYNGLTLTVAETGFTIAGGTTSKTLTVPLDASVSGTNTGDQTNITGTAAGLSAILASTSGGSGINNAGTLTWGAGGTLGTGAYATIANYLPLAGGTLTGTLNGIIANFSSTGTADYGLQVLGTAGGARSIFQAGQSGYSNGFTVDYNGTNMVYTMNHGSLSVGGVVSATGGTSTDWNKYNQWDGGATGLVAATGRTSLGLGTAATATIANYRRNNDHDSLSTLQEKNYSSLDGKPTLGTASAQDVGYFATAAQANATHTGDVTGATALTIGAGKVTLAMQANMATASFIGRNTALTGVPEVLSTATVKTMLGLGTAAYTASGDYATAGALTTHTALTTTAHGLGASAFHADAFFATAAQANATHTGDVTGATALTVVKINGTLMSGLATGILKNTTATGVPSIAIAADFPTLNQNTTGTAAGLSAILASTSGGSGINNAGTLTWGAGGTLGTSAYTATYVHPTTNGNIHLPVTGAANQIVQYSSAGTGKWITVSGDASIADGGAVTLATVTVPKGGTGLTTLTDEAVIIGQGTATPTFVAPSTAGNLLRSDGTNWASASLSTAGIQPLHASLTSIAGLTEAAGTLIYGTADNAYATLAAGATTTILVGGGAAAPVWTTATGTGAPVRAGSPTFTGTVSGSVASFSSTMTATNFILSDRRLKTKPRPISDLSKFDNIKFYQFSMLADTTHRKRYGAMADEVELIAEELVNTAQDSMKTKSVNYTDMLIGIVARQAEQIELLNKRLEILEKK